MGLQDISAVEAPPPPLSEILDLSVITMTAN